MARNRTKLIRYLLKKIGYDLRRIQKTTFIPEGAETGFGRGGGLDAFEPVIPRPVTAMDISISIVKGMRARAIATPARAVPPDYAHA